MIIIDKTLLFKSAYQGFGHKEFVNINALQSVIRAAYEKHAGQGVVIVNDSIAFHPANKSLVQTPFNSAVFKYINSFLKQKINDKSIILIDHKKRRVIDVAPLAPKITKIVTNDPRLLALWLRNPLIEFEGKLGRKFKLNSNWYYLARKNNVEETDKKALKEFIEVIVALTPARSNEPIAGLGQKGFNELIADPVARHTISLSKDFKARLNKARALLAADLNKKPQIA